MKYVLMAGKTVGYPLYLVLNVFVVLPFFTLLCVVLMAAIIITTMLIPMLSIGPLVINFVREVLL